MKIECTIPRPRLVTLGDTAYQFQADDKGRFVAEVNDEEHAERLLEIRCYRKLVEAKSPSAVKSTPAMATAPAIETAPEAAAVDTTNAANSGNPLTGQGLGGTIQPEDDGEDGDGNGQGEGEGGTETLDRAKLAAEYEKKFGKKPHHSQSAERIKQLLEQEDD